MNKLVTITIFFLIIFSTISIQPSYALGKYIKMPIRVNHAPQICAVEPQINQKFPLAGKKLLDETEYSILDWKTKLNQGLGRHPIWNFNYIRVPLGEQASFDYSKCDIVVHYYPEPQDSSSGFIATGVTIPNFETGKTNIEIYYEDIQSNWEKIEWTENSTRYYSYINKPYYTGHIATQTQIGSTIRHELGHSLGLAHYIVPYQELQNIINGLEDMPSIMIDTVTVLGVTHYDITPLDIKEIKSIYGDNGFTVTSDQPGYHRIKILNTDKNQYLPNERITARIDTSAFNNRSIAEILVIDSNNHLIQNTGIVKSNSTIPIFVKSYGNEKYWVELIDPITGNYDFTSFTVGSNISNVPANDIAATNTTKAESIPSWIKNNAGRWSQGTITDNDFTKGIEYLIKQKIIHVDNKKSINIVSEHIPQWIRNNAGLWSSGQIGDEEFTKTMQYLINIGLIHVEMNY